MSEQSKSSTPYLISLKSNTDSRGNIFYSEYGDLPFSPTRFFFLEPDIDLKPRGEHGHHHCWQVIFPVGDEIFINLGNRPIDPKYNLRLGSALVVPPKNWCQVLFKSFNSRAVVLASHKYDPDDYFYLPQINS